MLEVKIEGYRSRAVYKLEEINNKFKIFKKWISVIDLGCSWIGRSIYPKILKMKILSN